MPIRASIAAGPRRFQDDCACIFRVPWGIFGTLTLSLPVFALVFCVAYSVMHNFTESNRTHCGVWNFLPSISAATASYQPQSKVWKACIILHTLPRYFIIFSYMIFHWTVMSAKWLEVYSCLLLTTALTNFIEVTALLLLTLIPSSQNFVIHKSFFIIFIIASLTYMVLICGVASCAPAASSYKMRTSVKLKHLFLFLYVVFLFAASYLYYRHNTYCEAGVYSLFALSEYLFVLTNIAFHSTAILDFKAIAYDKAYVGYAPLV